MKVLIISHNAITTFNSMGKTILTLFSAFKSEELCQLYIYPTVPDIDKCASYFRITDKDVLKSYFKFKVRGRIINASDINENNHSLFENKKEEDIYRNKKNKLPLKMLLRDCMWQFSRWYTGDLKKWLSEQQPTCIFVAPGTSRFLYKIALKISKKFNLPIVTYICDDYYFLRRANTILGRIQQKKLCNQIKKLMSKSCMVISICDELKQAYVDTFNVKVQTVMTGSNYSIIDDLPSKKMQPQSITYMGSLARNRDKTLKEIGIALEEINKRTGSNFYLNVYSGESSQKTLNELKEISSIRLCGFIAGELFDQQFHQSEILLHVEAFDERSIDLVKHSISTKIADSLGSGICLFAYGPKQVASINYLLKNECAIVCTEKEKLQESLMQVFNDSEKREEIIKNALDTARKNHDCTQVGKRLYEIVGKIANESSSS